MRVPLLLAAASRASYDLRYCNTLIKLNDLLCSVACDIRDTRCGMAAACAIVLETSFVDNLYARVRSRHE